MSYRQLSQQMVLCNV